MASSDREYIITFDPGKCTQCHGCEIACKAWRELPHGIQLRRVLNLWHGEYPRTTSSSVALACLHCVDPACAAACPEEAIAKHAENGLVMVDRDLCTGCELCAQACPFGIPRIGADGTMVKCDLCRPADGGDSLPPCVDTCPGRALVLCEIPRQEKQAHQQKLLALLKSGM